MAYQWPVRVYIEDTDFGGLVYYANHLKFMERARTESLRAAGWSQAELIEAGIIFVVGRVNVRYLAPARLDQELCIETTIKEHRGARLLFAQAVNDRLSGQQLSRGEVEVICVEASRMRACRWPTDLIDTMRAKVPELWTEQE
ncbi:MAG TPA: tol-pal system-associated acyl-CoA thioesterase [Marinobacterium sp.]|nr:tol-pal system-associated acyl-CoA thioesterase [Marinobacterium sp.]